MIQIWEGDSEGREGGKKREKRKRDLKKIFIWFGFFTCLLDLEVSVISLEGLIKGSHHVLITGYIFQTLTNMIQVL